jgi:prepilin-type processing-associated H-X9-DG protein
MKRNDNRNKWKFTLLELLIVTAIIMILISILLPALSRAKETAKGINCAGNMRQLSFSSSSYMQDNNQILFMHYLDAPYETTWWRKLYSLSYLSIPRIVSCPSDPEINILQGVDNYRTYGLRDYRDADPCIESVGYKHYLNAKKIINPSLYYVFCDSVYGVNCSHSPGKQCYLVQKIPDLTVGGVYLRHCGRANSLFADGHTSSCGGGELKNIGFDGGMRNYASIIYF